MVKLAISKIEKVQMYRTSDGIAYSSMEDAIEHQRDLDFIKWYDDENEIYSRAEGRDVLDWLKENKEEVLEVLGVRNVS